MKVVKIVKDNIKIICYLVLGVLLFLAVSKAVISAGNRAYYDAWMENAFESPEAGSLNADGYIDITWKAADFYGDVSGYKLYLDEEIIAETDSETTTVEYKALGVTSHEVYMEVDFEDGTSMYSDIMVFYTNKKGFCTNKDMARKLTATDWGVSWYYNWDMTEFSFDSFLDLEYVPMMWTKSGTEDIYISRMANYGYKYILAYNEPDAQDQSNISVEDAVEGMKDFVDQGMYVVSPATALMPEWSEDWFQPFMESLDEEGIDLDVIAVHHYWNWYDDDGADAFIEMIENTYEMYGKPIWITEFAISGVPLKDGDPEREEVVQAYMENVINQLDELDYVERYAWFSFDPEDEKNGASAMYQHYTGEITDLGKLYMTLGMPEGYGDSSVEVLKDNPKNDGM